MAKRPAVAAGSGSLLEKYKNFPGIGAIERRLQSPEHEPGSVAIRLKDEPSFAADPLGSKRVWYLRWANTAQEGRWSTMVDAKGYVPVRVSELQNAEAVTGLHKADEDGKDPIVRRGDKGQEVLVKMPLELYTYVKREQEGARKRRQKNAKLVKEELANAAGKALGSEAGDTLNDEFSVSVKERRSSLQDELEGGDEDRA